MGIHIPNKFPGDADVASWGEHALRTSDLAVRAHPRGLIAQHGILQVSKFTMFILSSVLLFMLIHLPGMSISSAPELIIPHLLCPSDSMYILLSHCDFITLCYLHSVTRSLKDLLILYTQGLAKCLIHGRQTFR